MATFPTCSGARLESARAVTAPVRAYPGSVHDGQRRPPVRPAEYDCCLNTGNILFYICKSPVGRPFYPTYITGPAYICRKGITRLVYPVPMDAQGRFLSNPGISPVKKLKRVFNQLYRCLHLTNPGLCHIFTRQP